MSKIEVGLHAHHAAYQASNPPPASSAAQAISAGATTNATDQTLIETPFAKVNSVVPGSPAEDAGLKAGDKIRRFGNVNWINHEKLSKVAEVVQRNQGVSQVVHLSRSAAQLTSAVSPAECSCEGCKKRRGRSATGRAFAISHSEKQLGWKRFAWLPSSSCMIPQQIVRGVSRRKLHEQRPIDGSVTHVEYTLHHIDLGPVTWVDEI